MFLGHLRATSFLKFLLFKSNQKLITQLGSNDGNNAVKFAAKQVKKAKKNPHLSILFLFINF